MHVRWRILCMKGMYMELTSKGGGTRWLLKVHTCLLLAILDWLPSQHTKLWKVKTPGRKLKTNLKPDYFWQPRLSGWSTRSAPIISLKTLRWIPIARLKEQPPIDCEMIKSVRFCWRLLKTGTPTIFGWFRSLMAIKTQVMITTSTATTASIT